MLTQLSRPSYYVRLQFSDVESCAAWLGTISHTRTAEAHEMISAQVALVPQSDLPAIQRIRILELLYRHSRHLQDELAARFAGRALPLSIVEYSVWSTVLSLWQGLHAGYLECFRQWVRSDGTSSAQAALLALRCVELAGAAVREHHRVYRSVSSAYWQQLHEGYAAAERHGLADAPVLDPLQPGAGARTCASAYACSLLAHLANPYSMSQRQMDLMYRWVQPWASSVQIEAVPIASVITSVLAVDLRSGTPAASAARAEPGPAVRYLGTESLGRSLRQTLSQLRQGKAPAALGLGEDCRQPGCERLLTLLYIQWCGSGIGLLAPPSERGEDARACVGFGTVVQQLASEAESFRSGAAWVRTAFGPHTEHWNITTINAPGFIAVARGPECSARIAHHQLVALKRRSASAFQLAVVQWLKHEEEGDLSIGLRLLPGVPHLVKMRALDDENTAEEAAIALPAAPEMRTPATLVMPTDRFRAERIVNWVAEGQRSVRLVRSAERGVDFERVVFEPID